MVKSYYIQEYPQNFEIISEIIVSLRFSQPPYQSSQLTSQKGQREKKVSKTKLRSTMRTDNLKFYYVSSNNLQ